jgi:hypothetical protein
MQKKHTPAAAIPSFDRDDDDEMDIRLLPTSSRMHTPTCRYYEHQQE